MFALYVRKTPKPKSVLYGTGITTLVVALFRMVMEYYQLMKSMVLYATYVILNLTRIRLNKSFGSIIVQ